MELTREEFQYVILSFTASEVCTILVHSYYCSLTHPGLLLVEPAHTKAAAGSLSLSGHPMAWDLLAGVGGSCEMEWLEVAAAPPLTTLNKLFSIIQESGVHYVLINLGF